MNRYEVVIGATGAAIEIQFVDIVTRQPINLTNGTIKLLKGVSQALPSHNLSVSGNHSDAASGKVLWAGLGSDSFVSISDMGELTEALYLCEAKASDGSGKVYYSEERFEILWKKPLNG